MESIYETRVTFLLILQVLLIVRVILIFKPLRLDRARQGIAWATHISRFGLLCRKMSFRSLREGSICLTNCYSPRPKRILQRCSINFNAAKFSGEIFIMRLNKRLCFGVISSAIYPSLLYLLSLGCTTRSWEGLSLSRSIHTSKILNGRVASHETAGKAEINI